MINYAEDNSKAQIHNHALSQLLSQLQSHGTHNKVFSDYRILLYIDYRILLAIIANIFQHNF